MLADRLSHTNNSVHPANNSVDPAHRLVKLVSPSLLGRQLTVEFIGTFVLVLTIGLATSSKGAGELAPIAIGSALMVMVFAGGHISGAHYNPAVSLAMLLAGKLRRRSAAAYVITQLAAGALAALLVRALVGRATPAIVGSDWKILVGELIFTLALAYVVLNVTQTRATEGNSFYGLAIGFTGRHRDLRRGRDHRRSVQPRRRTRRHHHRRPDVEPLMDLHHRQRSRWSHRSGPLRLPPPAPCRMMTRDLPCGWRPAPEAQGGRYLRSNVRPGRAR
jgi:glycerol uptake facilitator-like aquaporin